MEEQKKEETKVAVEQTEAKVEVKKTDEELRKEAEEKALAAKKREEIYLKIADGIDKGTQKVDQLIDQRKKFPAVSGSVALGLLIFLVMALVKSPELIVYLAVGLLIGFSAKIIRMIFKK